MSEPDELPLAYRRTGDGIEGELRMPRISVTRWVLRALLTGLAMVAGVIDLVVDLGLVGWTTFKGLDWVWESPVRHQTFTLTETEFQVGWTHAPLASVRRVELSDGALALTLDDGGIRRFDLHHDQPMDALTWLAREITRRARQARQSGRTNGK